VAKVQTVLDYEIRSTALALPVLPCDLPRAYIYFMRLIAPLIGIIAGAVLMVCLYQFVGLRSFSFKVHCLHLLQHVSNNQFTINSFHLMSIFF